MAITQEQIKEALKGVKYPGFSRDIVSFGLLKEIEATNGDVRVQLTLTTNDPAVPRTIKAEAEHALREIPGVSPQHVPPGCWHSYFLYFFKLDLEKLGCTAREFATERENRRGHAAGARIERVHQLENLQRTRQRDLPSVGNICSRAKALLSAARGL